MRNMRKTIKFILIAAPVILIGAALLISKNAESKAYYSNYSVISEIALNTSAKVYQGNEKIYVCTKNGTRAYDTDGGLVFDISYSFDEPYVVSRKNAAAITETDGKKVYVISEGGTANAYETEYEIDMISVAENGTTAVLMENGLKDIIRIYSFEGKILVEIGTESTRDGIPVGISLSPDGKKIITEYISYDGDTVKTKITFYNTGEIGKNFIENIVGQRTVSGTAYKAEFLSNTRVGIFFPDNVIIYSMDEIPELLSETKITDVYDINVGENILITEYKDDIYNLLIYDSGFNLVSEVPNIAEYDSVIFGGSSEIIIKTGNLFTVYRKNGTKKFEATLPESTKNVFYGKNLRYFVVGQDSVRVISLEG